MFSILSVSIGITDKMNAADLLCMQKCRQTRDRTNGHLVESSTLLIELSSPSVKSVVYVSRFKINEFGTKYKVLINVYCNIPKFFDSLNIVVIMQKIN